MLLKKISRAFFSLHEHQSKKLLASAGIRVQRGETASTPQQALDIANELNCREYVIKCQVQAGGRGKGKLTSGLKGGVQLTKDRQKIFDFAKQMIGYNLITHQTPPEGILVEKVLVHEAVDFNEEKYLAILNDRKLSCPVVIASPEGGVEIEKLAETRPEAIKAFPVDIMEGLSKNQALQICDFLKLQNVPLGIEDAADQLLKLYNLFISSDSGMLEINPWAPTPDGIYAVDAKINIDLSALYRQEAIQKWREATLDNSLESKAIKNDLAYIELGGNVGCMVNGAGLAMATMDVIKNNGGEPANFLDVGGGSNIEKISIALSILRKHKGVKSILINIFGGILRCDLIAEALIQATKKANINKPIVVRMQGTNVEEAKKLLSQITGLKMIVEDDLELAAQKAVQLAR